MDQQTIQDLSLAGRHQECLQACQQLLQREPENPLPWKYAGKSLLALGQLKEAQQCLTKANMLNTYDPETAKDLGNTYLSLGITDEATKWYIKSIDIDNDYAPAINNLADIKRKSGDNEEAINLFKRAIKADPHLIQAYIGAAACLLALRNLDQAEAFATQAIAINNNAPGINEIIGIIFQNKGNLQQAIESYQKELAINPKSGNSLLNLGLLLLQQGKLPAAIKQLTVASAVNPSEQCSLLLAQAYQNNGQLKEAISEYKKFNISKSQNKMIPFNLGLCLLNTGNNNDAIEAFKIATKLDKSFVPAWGNIGTALMNEGRHHEALEATQKVLELDPNNPNALMNLGSINKNLGNLEEALAHTLKSIELKTDNHTAHMNLGSIYKDLGKLDQALAATLESLKLNPDNPDALVNLGGIYKNLGNVDQALASTIKSIELDPENHTAHMNLGAIYQELGHLDQALASTLKSLELKPNNHTAHMNLGGMYQDLGDLDQALASTLKSLELNPENPDAFLNLGGIYKNLGNLDQALTSTLKSIELKPDNPDALINLGGIYKDLDNLDQALAATLKSLELEPDNPDAHLNLGSIYQDLGNLDKALVSTLKSLELKPDNPEALLNLGGTYKDLGNHDKAIAFSLKSLELKPDSPEALMNLGGIYHGLGNLDKALASTLESLELKTDNPTALMNLGIIYRDLGRMSPRYIDNSINAFHESLRINPNNPNVKLGLDSARNELISSQEIMTINNSNRTSAFREAIISAISGGEHVIELGKSTGLYSMLAADNGAKTATKLVDLNTIKTTVEAIIKCNNLSDKVKVETCLTGEDVKKYSIAPKADILIVDLPSANFFDTKTISKIAKLKKILLKENGKSLPQSAEVKVALLGASSEVNDLLRVETVNGYDLSQFNNIIKKNHTYKLYEKPNIISDSDTIFKVDFCDRKETMYSEKSILLDSKSNTTCIGLIAWHKLNLCDGLSYEEDPLLNDHRDYSEIYLFENSFQMRTGQSAKIKCIINNKIGVWFELTGLTSQDEQIKLR